MNNLSDFLGIDSGFGWIIFVLVLLLFVGLIARLMSRNSKRRKFNSPLDILKTRYAKGEISKDEYDEKRRHIS